MKSKGKRCREEQGVHALKQVEGARRIAGVIVRRSRCHLRGRGKDCLVGLLLSMVGVSTLLARSSPSTAPEELGYSLKVWTVEDGLPATFIDFLAQTPDGYLWWPTDWGVGRFDGFRFHSLFIHDEAGKPEAMDGLFRDSRGRLWVWNSRRTLGTIEDGRYTSRGRSAHKPAPFGVFEGPAEGIWMSEWKSVEGGVLERLEGGEPEKRDLPPNLGFETQSCLGSDGTLWLWNSGSLFRAEGAVAVPVKLAVPDGDPDWLASMFFRFPEGATGVVGRKGVYRLEEGEWALWRRFEPAFPGNILLQRAAADRLGNVWIGSRLSGLWVVTTAGQLINLDLPGLVMPDGFGIGAVFADFENNVWAGARNGLYQLRRAPFREVLDSEPLAETEPVDIAQDRNGCFWVVTESGKILRYSPEGALLSEIPLPAHLSMVEADAEGSVWIASRNKVWRWDNGQLEPMVIAIDPGRPAPGFISMRAVGGTLWAGSDAGLWRSVDRQLVQESVDTDSRNPSAVLVGGNAVGQLRALVVGEGLKQPVDGEWKNLPHHGPISRQDVVGIHVDPESRTWAYGRNPPLQRWEADGWTEAPLGPTKLPVEVIAVESDDTGGLWGLTQSLGVFRLNRDFDQEQPPAPDWFGQSSGLPSISGRGWAKGMSKSQDGRIWAATSRGVAVIDPREWTLERDQVGVPLVHIEEVWLDDHPLDTRRPGGIVVPPRGNRIEIRFTALGLNNADQNHFRYQLEGMDETPQEAGTARSAVYHKLPPGQYRFRVTAANSRGIWNEDGATLAVSVLPAWWQALWFRLGLGAMILGSLAVVRHVQLNQLRRKQARQEGFARQLIQIQEAERKRLAGELHDDLGQDLLVLKSRLDTGRHDAKPGEERGLIGELSGAVTHLIRKVRDISHALRPLQLERLGLSSCVRGMVEEVSEATGVHIESEIDDLRGQLSPNAEIGLYRILQEALNNVVKHSDASEVRVALKRGSEHVILSVSDDGRGFTLKRLEEPGATGGHGLAGMAERCRLMGAHFEVLSSPGNGTSIRVEAPLGKSGANTTS